MQCKHFGTCGSCTFFELDYEAQLSHKHQRLIECFAPLYDKEIELFGSASEHYRMRSEFRVIRRSETLHYAMHSTEKKLFPIRECPKVATSIALLMPKLLESIAALGIQEKLFAIDFLTSQHADLVVTLIYHKALDDEWKQKASTLEATFNISIIGRSRKQKVVLSKESILETLTTDFGTYCYHYVENSFTQPNSGVNEKMLSWCIKETKNATNDLVELYCGAGNFTIALSQNFNKVLATEISTKSIAAAKENALLNGIDNIAFARLSAEEFTQAYRGEREFRRLKGVDLKSYCFSTLFVDPPRAGLDDAAVEFARGFDTIVYISCNPETLRNNALALQESHVIEKMAMFDQFPYTHHIETGAVFKRRR